MDKNKFLKTIGEVLFIYWAELRHSDQVELASLVKQPTREWLQDVRNTSLCVVLMETIIKELCYHVSIYPQHKEFKFSNVLIENAFMSDLIKDYVSSPVIHSLILNTVCSVQSSLNVWDENVIKEAKRGMGTILTLLFVVEEDTENSFGIPFEVKQELIKKDKQIQDVLMRSILSNMLKHVEGRNKCNT